MSNGYLICDLITNNMNKETHKTTYTGCLKEYHEQQKSLNERNESLKNNSKALSNSNMNKIDNITIKQYYCELIFKKLYSDISSVEESLIKQAPFLLDFVERDSLFKAINRAVVGNYDKVYAALTRYVFPKYITCPEEAPNMYIGYSTQDKLLTLYIVRNESQAGSLGEFSAFLCELEIIFRQPMGIYVTTQIPMWKDLDILKRDLKEYSVGIYKRSKCLSPKSTTYSKHFVDNYLIYTDDYVKKHKDKFSKRVVTAPEVNVGMYFSDHRTISPYIRYNLSTDRRGHR